MARQPCRRFPRRGSGFSRSAGVRTRRSVLVRVAEPNARDRRYVGAAAAARRFAGTRANGSFRGQNEKAKPCERGRPHCGTSSVPDCALPFRPRRGRSSGPPLPLAKAAKQRRSWLARGVAVDVRSANGLQFLTRFRQNGDLEGKLGVSGAVGSRRTAWRRSPCRPSACPVMLHEAPPLRRVHAPGSGATRRATSAGIASATTA